MNGMIRIIESTLLIAGTIVSPRFTTSSQDLFTKHSHQTSKPSTINPTFSPTNIPPLSIAFHCLLIIPSILSKPFISSSHYSLRLILTKRNHIRLRDESSPLIQNRLGHEDTHSHRNPLSQNQRLIRAPMIDHTPRSQKHPVSDRHLS